MKNIKTIHNWKPFLIYGLLCLIYAAMTYYVTLHLCIRSDSDFIIHGFAVVDSSDGGLQALVNKISYPGWHVVLYVLLLTEWPLSVCVSLTCAAFSFLTAGVTFWAFSTFFSSSPLAVVCALGVTALLVTAIYVPFFNPQVYVGQGSPTIWHNPTYNAIKPIALLTVLLFTKCLRERSFTIKNIIMLMALVVVGLLLKPSFFQVLFPAALLYIIIDYIKYRDIKILYKILSIFAIPLLIVLCQYWVLFGAEDTVGGIILTFFGVWSYSSPHVLVSAVLLLAFPIYALIMCRRSLFEKDSEVTLPLLILLIGFLEQSFLAESGPRMLHGNFGWGFCLAVFIVWIYSLRLFVKKALVKDGLSNAAIFVGGALILCHLFSGVYYFMYLITGDPSIMF